MRWLHDNIITRAGTIISVSSESIYQPLSNLQDQRLSRVFRTTAVSNQWIKISGGYFKASYVSILNHNITSSATIRIQGNNSDTWDNPEFSAEIPWDEYQLILNFSEKSFAFWRIQIFDSENIADYIEIANIYLGTYYQMPGMKPEQTIENETTSSVNFTQSGQCDGYDGFEFRNPSINHPRLTNSQRLDIIRIFQTIKNNHPIIFIIWANQLDYERPIYGVIEGKLLSFKKSDDLNFPWSLTYKIREVY